MKFLLTLILIITSLNSFAYEGKYVCQEYDRKSGKLLQRTVVLTPRSEVRDSEDADFEQDYYLELFEGADFFPKVHAKGLVVSEDVMFQFTSEDEEVSFFIYMDEMEESYLSLGENGKSSSFVCR